MKRNRLLGLITLAGALTLSSGAIAATGSTENALTPAQVKQVQSVIRSYLVENPEVLVAASEALQQQQMKKAEAKAKGAIGRYAKEIFNNPDSPVTGNPNGSVTLVEFMDYQCGHCREMAPVVEGLVHQDKNVRYVVKELPIFGATSRFAAEIALAAYKQNPKNFGKLHAALFKLKKPLTTKAVLSAARKAGYNSATLEKMTKNDKALMQQIKANFTLAQELGIIGTPTFIVANRDGTKTTYVPGATSKANLQRLLKSAAS